ncbi:MAG TPA: nucleotidyltransferase domain-containing protein [Candidatus Paceibacterota bacterium]
MLTQEQKSKIKRLAQTEGVRFIVLHGSRADGTAKAKSDFDVAILLLADNITDSLSRYGNLLAGMSSILDAHDDMIDFTDLRQANILLKYEVVRKGILLYGDPYEYELFKLASIRDYQDAGDLRNLEQILIAKRQILLAH